MDDRKSQIRNLLSFFHRIEGTDDSLNDESELIKKEEKK